MCVCMYVTVCVQVLLPVTFSQGQDHASAIIPNLLCVFVCVCVGGGGGGIENVHMHVCMRMRERERERD